MDTTKVRIAGDNVREIINLLDIALSEYTLHPHEDIYIFIGEKYYFRNNSQLMSCLIVKFEGSDTCLIDIVSGGGSTGLLDIDLGAESNRTGKIKNQIKDICKRKGWKTV